MALNSSDIDHGDYVPTPIVSGVNVGDGQSLKQAFVLGGEGDAPDAYASEVPSGFVVGAGAKLDLTVIVLPGYSGRIPITVDLVGEESEVRLAGIYLCNGADEVTFDITMHHRVGGCVSNQVFNGLAASEASCGFFGKIVVAPDAQKTEAYQQNHNIVLSDEARVNTKPRLEIYADDVKCSHGATVGRLDEDEQFYMRSRGIPEEEAKVLQMISFVAPVLYGLDNSLEERVEAAIRQML